MNYSEPHSGQKLRGKRNVFMAWVDEEETQKIKFARKEERSFQAEGKLVMSWAAAFRTSGWWINKLLVTWNATFISEISDVNSPLRAIYMAWVAPLVCWLRSATVKNYTTAGQKKLSVISVTNNLQSNYLVLYCIVTIYLYSASCSAHQSEALPVRETQREESSLERTKRRTWHTS